MVNYCFLKLLMTSRFLLSFYGRFVGSSSFKFLKKNGCSLKLVRKNCCFQNFLKRNHYCDKFFVNNARFAKLLMQGRCRFLRSFYGDCLLRKNCCFQKFLKKNGYFDNLFVDNISLKLLERSCWRSFVKF